MSPNNWDIQVRDFELGESAPTISDVQVLNDTAKPGKFSAMDMAVTFDTGMARRHVLQIKVEKSTLSISTFYNLEVGITSVKRLS